MGWFWQTPESAARPRGMLWAAPLQASVSSQDPIRVPVIAEAPSECPVRHEQLGASARPIRVEQSPPSECPVRHTPPASECPVRHDTVNPLNMMPELSSTRVPGQQIALPTQRTTSSIPRGDAGYWEYPSPQQMLNAMVRKSGPAGIEEDAVESMVDVHNFLNEGVWKEVVEWEKPYTQLSGEGPQLLKFQGRPGDLSPRALMFSFLGKIYPSRFAGPLPFDRHDWTVLRRIKGSSAPQSVRYVIDFYEAPEEDDMPTFSVDVRPALDSLQALRDRVSRALTSDKP